MHRKKFIQQLALTGLSFSCIKSFAFQPTHPAKSKSVKIGWITDVHHGYCKDASSRLEHFIKHANRANLDMIIQGGDFCHPTTEAKAFMGIWNDFKGDKYHVLGNHDMDKGSKQDVMEIWGMEKPYYSFDKGDFRFFVLDCNHILQDGKYIDYEKSNYYIDSNKRDLIDPKQIEWLRNSLSETEKQCVIISHQSFDDVWTGYTVPNKMDVRKVIDEANKNSKNQKVIACFCGHHHLDNHMVINDVHYFHINSASYYYAGEGYGSDGGMAMYTDPLYCFVTIDPKGKIIIEGREGQFVSPTPTEKNHPQAARITARIEGKEVGFNTNEK